MSEYIQTLDQRFSFFESIPGGGIETREQYDVSMHHHPPLILEVKRTIKSNQVTVVEISITNEAGNILFEASGDGLDGKILESAKAFCETALALELK
jgi:hypothetical protein